jgi:hypothetical protein
MALIPYWTKKIQREEGCGGTRLDASSRCNAIRTWLNDAVIQDYSFFLNKVANESEASVLFLSPVKQTTDAIARPCERVVLYIIARRAQIDIADLVSEI